MHVVLFASEVLGKKKVGEIKFNKMENGGHLMTDSMHCLMAAASGSPFLSTSPINKLQRWLQQPWVE